MGGHDAGDDGAWPEELRLRSGKDGLVITFTDGVSGELSAEFLRVWSPSAEVRGHGAADRKTVGGKQGVRITALEPIGNYAVRIVFDDGHDTGLYGWRLLRSMVTRQEAMWGEYLAELAHKGMSRQAFPGKASPGFLKKGR
ncbi:hypothetical protein GCM10019059_28870 [Camelimonas fluminis]|uniref:Gamma-butyrobetaine hydroxylase-like domain-containing protein n=1 Tax=Camelimonas fluminis TaxID=1576911 RepID=A0ABV7UEW7_9HYPH|nr:DUF971 domain-containing protein [Camelimonas fluminis]GHE67304.1 hypothetical protein GCM10019059_28870 [Camelimonas fluminis]